MHCAALFVCQIVHQQSLPQTRIRQSFATTSYCINKHDVQKGDDDHAAQVIMHLTNHEYHGHSRYALYGVHIRRAERRTFDTTDKSNVICAKLISEGYQMTVTNFSSIKVTNTYDVYVNIPNSLRT